MNDTLSGFMVIAVVVTVIITFLIRASEEFAWQEPRPDERGRPSPKDFLRERFLSGDAEQLGICVPDNESGIWVVGMDISFKEGTATIVATVDGSTSVYFGGGGGTIGGESNESVRRAAIKLVSLAEDFAKDLVKAESPPKPPPAGRVQLIAQARSGLLVSRSIAETEIQDEHHPLFPCYAAVQHLLASLRTASGVPAWQETDVDEHQL